MQVLQIYTHVPEPLKGCIASVKAYIKRVGAIPVVMTQPSKTIYSNPCTWSDIKRMEYLAHNMYTLYVDWDVLLYDNFYVCGDKPLFGDLYNNIMYSGADTGFFKRKAEEFAAYAEKTPTHIFETARIWKMLKQEPIVHENQIDKSMYHHYVYSCVA